MDQPRFITAPNLIRSDDCMQAGPVGWLEGKRDLVEAAKLIPIHLSSYMCQKTK